MRLLILAPCEKVLLQQPEGQASLISVFGRLNVQIAKEQLAQLPKDAIVPHDWYIYTQWLLTPDEFNTEFTQKCEIVLPSQNILGVQSSLSFTVNEPSKTIAQNVIEVKGFPIGHPGTINVKVWIQKGSMVVTDVHSYPLEVIHIPMDMPEPAAKNVILTGSG